MIKCLKEVKDDIKGNWRKLLLGGMVMMIIISFITLLIPLAIKIFQIASIIIVSILGLGIYYMLKDNEMNMYSANEEIRMKYCYVNQLLFDILQKHYGHLNCIKPLEVSDIRSNKPFQFDGYRFLFEIEKDGALKYEHRDIEKFLEALVMKNIPKGWNDQLYQCHVQKVYDDEIHISIIVWVGRLSEKFSVPQVNTNPVKTNEVKTNDNAIGLIKIALDKVFLINGAKQEKLLN